MFDHGAQFFTVRSDEFGRARRPLAPRGRGREWCRGFGDHADGYPRYFVRGGMNALAKHLARDLDVRCQSIVFAIRPSAPSGWSVGLDDGTTIVADALIVTCPLPQASSLLVTGRGHAARRRSRPAVRPHDRAPGSARRFTGDPDARWRPPDRRTSFSFVADNRAKGISPVDAVTFHAAADMERGALGRRSGDQPADLLRRAAETWLGGGVDRRESVETMAVRNAARTRGPIGAGWPRRPTAPARRSSSPATRSADRRSKRRRSAGLLRRTPSPPADQERR